MLLSSPSRYLAPAVNPPLQPLLSALQANIGQLLWQVPLPETTTYELTIFDETIYVSTHRKCCAMHASDGSHLWSQILQEHGQLFSRPIVMDEAVYVNNFQFISPFAQDTHTFMTCTQVHLHTLSRGDGTSLWNVQLAAAKEGKTASVDDRSCTGDADGHIGCQRH